MPNHFFRVDKTFCGILVKHVAVENMLHILKNHVHDIILIDKYFIANIMLQKKMASGKDFTSGSTHGCTCMQRMQPRIKVYLILNS